MTKPKSYGPPIILSEAKRVAEAAEAEAAEMGLNMVISVADSTGNLLVLHRMDGAQLGSVAISQAKARTAVNFKRPTKTFEDALESGGRNLRILSMEGVCPLEGGVLLFRNDEIVGAIGVSGAHPTEDGEVAAAGAKALPE